MVVFSNYMEALQEGHVPNQVFVSDEGVEVSLEVERERG